MTFDGMDGGWFDSGLDALHDVCRRLPVFTSCDVWDVWDGPQPEQPTRMAEILDQGIAQGWCTRQGPVGGHSRRAGNAGFGARYLSRLL